MTDLERDLYRSLADVVVKLELELESLQAITPGRPIPCACDSMRAGPGCKPCLVKRARKVMAEYEAAEAAEKLYCSTCGLSDPENITVQADMFGREIATCRACYVAAREREMAVAK